MIDARENGNVDTPCFQFRPSMKYHERMTTTDSSWYDLARRSGIASQ